MAIIIPEIKTQQDSSKKLRRAMERGSVLMSALVLVILLAQHEQSLNAMQSGYSATSDAHYNVVMAD